MKNFAIIGVAGYIAPRHLNAINETGNVLVAALDVNDSVGVLDRFFPDARFFTEFERFDRHIDLLKRKGTSVDYVSILSPNYLHDSHIRFALRVGATAICEKPLVVNPWNIDSLKIVEQETGLKVYNILQLRLHPNIVAIRDRVAAEISRNPYRVYDINLTYLTSRGHWYFASWKGEETKSGGIVANIGVHLFDMLLWLFGPVKLSSVNLIQRDCASGTLEFTNARVRWFLSVNYDHIPDAGKAAGQRSYRSVTIDGDEVEFSGGFTDLHLASYQHILAGNGFGLEDALPSINLVHSIRTAPLLGKSGEYHPFLDLVITK